MQNDILVLVLSLEQYQNTNLLTQSICGRTMVDWVNQAMSSFQTKTINVSPAEAVICMFSIQR